MKLSVFNTIGEETGRKVSLSKDVFAIEPNDHAIYLDVKLILANRRQGTHKSKERAEVNYSTKKLKRQKGTGGARAGSIKSPVFVGGGRIFGPKPRDYSFKLNKKVKLLARKSALSYKAKDNEIILIEQFNFEKPSTKSYNSILTNLKLGGKKTLFVLPEGNKNVYLSSRNIQGTKVVTANELNTYDILNAHNIVVVENALPTIESTLKLN
jgi:large subunit ribosomal protein L4